MRDFTKEEPGVRLLRIQQILQNIIAEMTFQNPTAAKPIVDLANEGLGLTASLLTPDNLDARSSRGNYEDPPERPTLGNIRDLSVVPD